MYTNAGFDLTAQTYTSSLLGDRKCISVCLYACTYVCMHVCIYVIVLIRNQCYIAHSHVKLRADGALGIYNATPVCMQNVHMYIQCTMCIHTLFSCLSLRFANASSLVLRRTFCKATI
jgi:hypothetical protein